MKGIIIYSSKYGAARRYAGWLAEETGFDCIETEKARIEVVKQYDTIIFGGGIYASGIRGLSFLKKNIQMLEGKKVIIFCVGASPYDETAVRQVTAYNLKGPLADLPCYYCRGAWDMEKMSVLDRNLCKLLRKAVGKKKPEEFQPWEQALMEAGDSKCDWTDRAYLDPILEAVK